MRLCCFPKGIGPNKERGTGEEKTPSGERQHLENNGLLHPRSQACPPSGQGGPGRGPEGTLSPRTPPLPALPWLRPRHHVLHFSSHAAVSFLGARSLLLWAPHSWLGSKGQHCLVLEPSDRQIAGPTSFLPGQEAVFEHQPSRPSLGEVPLCRINRSALHVFVACTCLPST